MVTPLTLGVEEEYLLVDLETRDLVREPPSSLLAECQARAPDQVSPEFLRCQVEIGTRVCGSLREARDELARLRGIVSAVAREHGLAPIAASTHPFAVWRPQVTTSRERYSALAQDIGAPVRRLMICGMHVHAGIPEEDLRIDLMNQVRYFLPHLLALSTSSPFWQGLPTGLKSYRLSVWKELPRTGIPEEYGSYGEYMRTVNALVTTGVIEDASKIWWSIRPSTKFPTLEMRITDICTRIDDCITIAALYTSLLHMLHRLRKGNVKWRSYKSLLIEENVWRAQRYGINEGLIDFGKPALVPYADLLEEMIDLVREDALALGCLPEVESARDILKRGTSADRQLAIYHQRVAEGASEKEALQSVVDWLVAETMSEVPSGA